MRPLSWQEYTTKFDSWSERTRESYVSRLADFGDHYDVACHVNHIYTLSIASKLANMAMDAGVRFDDEDIYLMEFSINEETMKRVKETADNYLLKKQKKQAKREAFWSGVAQVEFFDTLTKEWFGKNRE